MPIHPARICAELTKHVPDDGIVVVDTGHAGMWMGGMYDLRVPTQSYIRSAGHLGWAFPAGARRQGGVPGSAGDRVSPATPASGTTSPRSKRRCAGTSTPSSVVNNNGGGNQSKRGFDRAYAASRRRSRANCGPTIR